MYGDQKYLRRMRLLMCEMPRPSLKRSSQLQGQISCICANALCSASACMSGGQLTAASPRRSSVSCVSISHEWSVPSRGFQHGCFFPPFTQHRLRPSKSRAVRKAVLVAVQRGEMVHAVIRIGNFQRASLLLKSRIDCTVARPRS